MRHPLAKPKMKPCYDCRELFPANQGGHLRCTPCRNKHDQRAAEAHGVVAAMVRAGLLPNLKAYAVACCDCGKRADRFDHRDYAEPLRIAPVCRACNRKRGTVVSAAA